MTEPKHTPGPWERTCTAFGLLGVASVATWERIVMLTPYKDDPKYGESYANANLIAASPDLLPALENLLASALVWADSVQYDRDTSWDYNAEPVIVAARAAIAKAKGEPCPTE